MRRAWIALLLLSGRRDILGIEELTGGVADSGVDAIDPLSCTSNAATGECHSCLASACCAEVEACNREETCQRPLSCVLSCAPDDDVCVANCVPRFGEKLANVLSCRSRSCSKPCATTCGGTFGAHQNRAVAKNAKCAECYRATACAENIACTNDPKCLASLGCAASCSLEDRSCAYQCRFPLGEQPGADKVTNTLAACRTACREGVEWSCVDVPGKYAVGAFAGSVDVRFTAVDALKPSVKLKGVTFTPCLDGDCTKVIGTPCTTDENGYCAMKAEITAPGNIFRGFMHASGGDVYPTLFFIDPPVTGPWPGSPSYTPATAACVTQDALSLVSAAGLNVMDGYGHLLVTAFDCLWAPAEGLTISVSRTDANTQYAYLAGLLPSTTATTTDKSGVAYAFNVPPGKELLTLTLKSGDRVVSETRVPIRANTLTFGLVGPK